MLRKFLGHAAAYASVSFLVLLMGAFAHVMAALALGGTITHVQGGLVLAVVALILGLIGASFHTHGEGT